MASACHFLFDVGASEQKSKCKNRGCSIFRHEQRCSAQLFTNPRFQKVWRGARRPPPPLLIYASVPPHEDREHEINKGRHQFCRQGLSFCVIRKRRSVFYASMSPRIQRGKTKGAIIMLIYSLVQTQAINFKRGEF